MLEGLRNLLDPSLTSTSIFPLIMIRQGLFKLAKGEFLRKFLLKHFLWRSARENLEVNPILALRQMLAKRVGKQVWCFYQKMIVGKTPEEPCFSYSLSH